MLLLLDDPRSNPRVTGWCPKCQLSWTGTRDAHCVLCCRHFGSEEAFDAHQRVNKHGQTVCRDPLKLRGRLVLDDRTWREAEAPRAAEVPAAREAAAPRAAKPARPSQATRRSRSGTRRAGRT